MTRPTLLLRRAVLLALAATVLLAAPASAHPFIQGGEAPVDSLASLVLDLAHGCQADDGHDHGEGDEEPTTEVALEVPDEVRIVEVPEVEGFEVDTEVGDDSDVEVVTWTATTSTEPAPQLPFDAVISGAPGDELYLRVFQGCGESSYRWVGTPDEPADDPAVRLTLTEPDPDSPPPDPDSPPPDPPGVEPEEPTGDAGEPADTVAEEAPDEEGGDEDAEPATVAAPSDPENSPLLWAVVALAGTALLVALLLALRPRPAASPAPDAGEPGGAADDTAPGGEGSS